MMELTATGALHRAPRRNSRQIAYHRRSARVVTAASGVLLASAALCASLTPASGATLAPPASAASGSQPTAATPAGASGAAPAAGAPALPTVREILDRSLAARGGKARLGKVESRRETGRLSLAAGTEWPFTIEQKRPRDLRMEIDLQGNRLVRAYDGVHGWQQQPQKKVAEEMSTDDRRNVANEADFDGPLADTLIKGHADLLGKATVEGHDVYQVKVTLLDGDILTYDIDAATWLPTHAEGARWINGRAVLFESSFADYRDVDGIKYPFLIEIWAKGSTQKQRRTFAKIENNPPLDDNRFAVPPDALPAPVTPPNRAATPTAPPAKPPASTPPPPAAPSTPPPPAAPATPPPGR